MINQFYTTAVRHKGKVVAYAVHDNVGGIVSQHAEFSVDAEQTWEQALERANSTRDRLNAKAKLKRRDNRANLPILEGMLNSMLGGKR